MSLPRWKQQQAQDKIRAGDKYTDYGFIVTNEFGHYFEQKTFKDYYDRLLKDADIGHFTFHALRHTFATIASAQGVPLFDIGKAWDTAPPPPPAGSTPTWWTAPMRRPCCWSPPP